jgi:hypothetical protein
MLKKIYTLVLFAFISVTVIAQEVECMVNTGGSASVLSIKPTIDVYDYSMLDTLNGFRVSAQVNIEKDKLKTSVYYKAKSKYVLITQQNFALSEFQCNKALSSQVVYGGRLEQELLVACTKLC